MLFINLKLITLNWAWPKSYDDDDDDGGGGGGGDGDNFTYV
jgi:hypothetical protein